MEPAAMRHCISFGFSDKNAKTSIGQYGNGFKTSSMRLGADVIVFSRHMKNSKRTQSVGLLSYTFLMKTQQDRIVVPMVDYLYDEEAGTWKTIHQEQHVQNNLAILLQWSPFTTEAELVKQCDDIGPHGTKIIVYNLWHNDEGKLELDFDTDPEDICLARKSNDNRKRNSEANERHLANRLQYSLRAYLSILYLRVPTKFSILLCGRRVEYHNIANDLKYPQFIMYRPQHVQGEVITTIGFVKEAPAVNVHGFNVYHKNRLILPFWHVVTFSACRGRGVVGVLEANFIEPIHNKQDFEKTPVFQKLETRLKEMTQEYWDYHCGLIGYLSKKKPQPMTDSSVPMEAHRMFQPVVLGRDSSGFIGAKVSPSGVYEQEMDAFENHVAKKFRTSKRPHLNSQGAPPKRKRHGDVVKSEEVVNTGISEPITADIAPAQNIQSVHDLDDQLEDQQSIHIIEENKRLHTQCKEYEKGQEELNQKVTHLMAEIREARREYARLLLDSNLIEKAKQGKQTNNLTQA